MLGMGDRKINEMWLLPYLPLSIQYAFYLWTVGKNQGKILYKISKLMALC